MKKKSLKIDALLILIAIVFIIIGLYHNEAIDVMKKASMICFECIGIG